VIKFEEKKIEKSIPEFSTYHVMKAVCKILYKSDDNFGQHKHFSADRRIFEIFQSPKMAYKPKNLKCQKNSLQHCIASPQKTLHAKNG